MKNSYKILLSAALVLASLLVIGFANLPNIREAATGNFILVGGYAGTVASIAALVTFFYVYWKDRTSSSQPQQLQQPAPQTDVRAAEDLYKIRGVLERYGSKKKVDFYAIHRAVLNDARDLFYNHHFYLDRHGSLGQYVKDIVTSSNPRAHGHFDAGRGEGMLIGLFRELGLYNLIKYKI